MSGNQNKTDKNDESSGSEQQFGGTESTMSIADTLNNHIYDPRKDEKDKLLSNSKSFVTTKPFQGSFGSPKISTLKTSRQNDLLDFSSNNLQDNKEPEEQTPIRVEPGESRLVDFPVFKGGNQDLVEWIEAFSRACVANRVSKEQAI
ncbi:hypothetical protein RhiirC2_770245, partial [Rhizophagus irregularis]